MRPRLQRQDRDHSGHLLGLLLTLRGTAADDSEEIAPTRLVVGTERIVDTEVDDRCSRAGLCKEIRQPAARIGKRGTAVALRAHAHTIVGAATEAVQLLRLTLVERLDQSLGHELDLLVSHVRVERKRDDTGCDSLRAGKRSS